MTKEIDVADSELEALMADLELQNEVIMAAAKVVAVPEKAAEPPKVTLKEVVPEPEPEPVPEPAPAPTPVVAAAPKATVQPWEDEVTPEPEVKVAAPPAAKKKAALQFYADADQFVKDTRVSDIDLDKCLIEQNSLRAYYGVQAAQAEAQASRLKARFEVVEATLYERHRKAFAEAGEKTTVQMVDSAVKMDPAWLSGKNLLIEAETIAAINKTLVESLRDRKDMLVQLGADRRDEFKGQARVMAEQNDRDSLRERALQAAQRKVS